jgi:hypothetical protein
MQMSRLLGSLLTWLLTVLISVAVQAQPQRFDMVVRSDFFAGFAGDDARLAAGMTVCEKTLADNPRHAEALVWHGAGLFFRSGQAFQKGDMQTGMDLWTRGLKEMDSAVEIAPDDIGVRVPRGAVLLVGSRNAPPDMAKPLLKKALEDYEHTLELHGSSFAKLGDHPKGELLFGLAEGYGRLGDAAKARQYFEQLIADAPASGHAPQAKAYVADGTMPSARGLGCVGCHK